METKEAIKFCEQEGIGEGYTIEYNEKILAIIRLLQRGETDRKIIDEMKNEKYDVWVSSPRSFTNISDFVRDIENEVKQKYFPKPKFKRQFTLDFETEDVHVIRNIDSTMKEFFSYGKFRGCGVKLGTYKENLPKDFTEKVMAKIDEGETNNE